MNTLTLASAAYSLPKAAAQGGSVRKRPPPRPVSREAEAWRRFLEPFRSPSKRSLREALEVTRASKERRSVQWLH